MSTGIVLEIQASLLLLGEGVVATISKVGHRQFHTIKTINDVILTLINILLAWMMPGNVEGIMVKFFKRQLQQVETWINR